MTVNYDSYGNIVNKSDRGAYSYASGAGPHAVTSIAGVANAYDANGNYTATGSSRTVTYNTFDKPLTMSSGADSTTFTYGPDRDYYKRENTYAGFLTNKTLYLAGVEKVYKPDNSRQERRYLPGGAYQIKNYDAAGTLTGTTVEYLLDDKQDSVDVIADANGNVQQAMSFDAWGMRRNPSTWVNLTSAAGFDNSQTSHGYTDHEMVDNLDIIHMHGRIYDARWGRMLQADPYIQEPTNSQSQNRFAYVNNNPLMFIDPTGYWSCLPGEICVTSSGYNAPFSISPLGGAAYGSSSAFSPFGGAAIGATGSAVSVQAGKGQSSTGKVNKGELGESADKKKEKAEKDKLGSLAWRLRNFGTSMGVQGLSLFNSELDGGWGGGAHEKWTAYDFVAHYFKGNADPVDLGDVGLGDDFRNSESVKQLVTGYIDTTLSRAFDGYTNSDVKVSNVTWDPGLFSVGNSSFFMNSSCGAGMCNFSFGIKDWFIDPLDIGGAARLSNQYLRTTFDSNTLPTEIRGGIPYRINYQWQEQRKY